MGVRRHANSPYRRDAGLRRARHLTRTGVAAAIALTLGFAELASQTKAGAHAVAAKTPAAGVERTTAARAPRTAHHHHTRRLQPRVAAPAPVAQAPPAPPPPDPAATAGAAPPPQSVSPPPQPIAPPPQAPAPAPAAPAPAPAPAPVVTSGGS